MSLPKIAVPPERLGNDAGWDRGRGHTAILGNFCRGHPVDHDGQGTRIPKLSGRGDDGGRRARGRSGEECSETVRRREAGFL